MCGQASVCLSKRCDAGNCGVSGSNRPGAWIAVGGRRRPRGFAQEARRCREGAGRVVVSPGQCCLQAEASAASCRVSKASGGVAGEGSRFACSRGCKRAAVRAVRRQTRRCGRCTRAACCSGQSALSTRYAGTRRSRARVRYRAHVPTLVRSRVVASIDTRGGTLCLSRQCNVPSLRWQAKASASGFRGRPNGAILGPSGRAFLAVALLACRVARVTVKSSSGGSTSRTTKGKVKAKDKDKCRSRSRSRSRSKAYL